MSNPVTPPAHASVLALGGGCFWCTEAVYLRVRGVLSVQSGYSNGELERPSYEQVCSGRTGHNEVVRLVYDPHLVSTRKLLEIFFTVHDPTTLDRQGNDVGTQYRSGIYYTTEEQAQEARDMISQLDLVKVFAAPIVTEVLPLSNYWPAEDHHQNYFEKHPEQGYCAYVVAPKVDKLRRNFRQQLIPGAGE